MFHEYIICAAEKCFMNIYSCAAEECFMNIFCAAEECFMNIYSLQLRKDSLVDVPCI